MKKILGLDLGTNSIGWAVINAEEQTRDDNTTFLSPTGISSAGSRIIPMGEDALSNFNSGKTSKNSTVKSAAAQRTDYRGMRRLRERNLLRRERLLRVLNILGFLPEHYAKKINRYGKFVDVSEPKIAWTKNADGKQEFLFQESFKEMLADFAQNQPQLVEKDKKIPYDWTIYYLRKKALSQPITKEELAWISLQFNQKRGYYQLRDEEEEEDNAKAKTRQYFDRQVIEDIVDTGEVYKGLKVLNVILQNGDTGKIFKKEIPIWKGQEKNIIVTVDIDKDGNDRFDDNGQLSRRFKIPTEAEWESEWKLIKLKTEKDLDDSKKTVGSFIYDTLLVNPNQKIIGKLVRTVERRFYKDELRQILDFQKNYIPELQNEQLFNDCVEDLYPHNEAHRNNISKIGFTKLFVDDILFYQRPLKTKKSLISNCPYENKYPVKCIAKSNPYFQEFRLWQFIHNLKIYQREKIVGDTLYDQTSSRKVLIDVDVTNEFLKNEEDYVNLFDFLSKRKSIKQDILLNSHFNIKKEKGKDVYPYRWNYVEDKEYPCCETRATIVAGLEKCNADKNIDINKVLMALWHILYSVDDKNSLEKALKTFAKKHPENFGANFVDVFSNIKPFKKEYGSYSEKAIKKLLPLMRCGKYWNADAIDPNTKDRIEKLITGEYDENISNQVREKTTELKNVSDFQGLPVWLACYVVYNRHAEATDCAKWSKPEDIDKYLKDNFKQHSLHNPVVEQVITETLRTVRDIWKQEGQIDEIHLELGREMKNPANKRKEMSDRIQENENTNLRIKALLMEFMNDKDIENVRPYSPSQQDILRIYEENALANLKKGDENFDFVSKISKQAQPSKNDIIRYKCWLEQKYLSPYTGKPISFARLFTDDYQIEHVIPRALYFDDSFSNKVICEAKVNEEKGATLAHKFISEKGGKIIETGFGEKVKLFTVEEYEKFVKEHYSNNRLKMKKLLMDDIPDDFIERQLNDSRYISKLIKGLLSNIVREVSENGEVEQEAVSKNLISCNGAITDRLKKDWGMNDVWNSIILPRFRRLNELTGKDCFTTTSAEGHEIPSMPFELQKGFNKKRIDHRHHAMDAIVIACTTRDHVNLLNNEAAHSKHNANRYQLQCKLRSKDNNNHFQEFIKPWETFTSDAKQALENIIVSFKQNLRVINKAENHYQHYENGEKKFVKQNKGDNWAIRKSMHKETVFGEVNLKFKKQFSFNDALNNPQMIVNKDLKEQIIKLLNEGRDAKYIKKYFADNKDVWSDVNLSKIEMYYFTQEDLNADGKPKVRYFATRKPIDTSFNKDKIENSVTDTAIQKILLAHLEVKGGDPELAFSPDGIDEMNRNIKSLNEGKAHQPIYKVRVYEKAEKFAVGEKGNKSSKFVEANDGTNLFFVVYETKDRKRAFASIPFPIAMECQKTFQSNWMEELDKKLRDKSDTKILEPYQKLGIPEDARLLFVLSPNDLVYIPDGNNTKIDKSRIFVVNDFNDITIYFRPYHIAKAIAPKEVDMRSKYFKKENTTKIIGSYDDKTANFDGGLIRETCVPLKVDRLGNIIQMGL